MNKNKNEFSDFFFALAERRRNENDLSDITYALCYSDDEFCRFFLDFCFDEDIKTFDLTREYQRDSSRPDFYFHDLENQERIIEVKIYDRNQHFEQYEKAFPSAKYAFIANYQHEKVAGWKIKTWKDFIIALEQSALCNKKMIEGYLHYLKSLINVKEFSKMNLNSCKSLPDFLENLKSLVKQDFGFDEYNALKSCNEYYYGQFFRKQDLYCWIGLYLPEANIYIGFKDSFDWIPRNFQIQIKNLVQSETQNKLFGVANDSDGNYGDFWFRMEKSDILFDDNVTVEIQKTALKDFISEVFTVIGVKKEDRR